MPDYPGPITTDYISETPEGAVAPALYELLPMDEVMGIFEIAVKSPDRRSVDLVLRVCDEQCKARDASVAGIVFFALVIPAIAGLLLLMGKVSAWLPISVIAAILICWFIFGPAVRQIRSRPQLRLECEMIQRAAARTIVNLASSGVAQFSEVDKGERKLGKRLARYGIAGYAAAWQAIVEGSKPRQEVSFPDL